MSEEKRFRDWLGDNGYNQTLVDFTNFDEYVQVGETEDGERIVRVFESMNDGFSIKEEFECDNLIIARRIYRQLSKHGLEKVAEEYK